jgi:CheY-like chemotaxis protein
MDSQDRSPADRLKRVSELLKLADRYVLAGEFEMASRQVEEVFKIDPKNIYAQAYLKRIEVFRQRGGSQPASGIQAGEAHSSDREDKGLHAPGQKPSAPDMSGNLIRVAESKRINPEELRRLVEEIISKESDTLTPSGKGNVQVPSQMPSPPLSDQEQSQQNRNELEYRRVLEKLWKDGSITDDDRQDLEELRTTLDIPHETHEELERSVKLAAYVNAVKDAWQDGLITPTSAAALDELRDRYDISVDEHLMIESRILFELHGMKVKGVVLVVDDDVDLAKVVKSVLREDGYSPFSATSPEQALMILERTTPDLILLDITFPKPSISGFTMYEKIRKIPRLQFVPVIFISGLDEEHIIQVGKQLGADDYITKPCSEQMLLSSVEGKIKRYNELKKTLAGSGEESP